VLVVSHVDPDGDSLGTQLAFSTYLKSLGKVVYLVREDRNPAKYEFLPGIDQIPHIRDIKDELDIDTVVSLECPTFSRAGDIVKKISDDLTIINIDHHQDNDNFGAVNWIDKEASSVGEMVYEMFEYFNYRIDNDTAVQLYTAILTDTGRFRFESTSARTMEIAGKLIEAGANPREICDKVFYNLQTATMKLIGYALSAAEFINGGKVCVISLPKEILYSSEFGKADSEGIAEYSLYGKDVTLGVVFKETENGSTRVSLRSRGEPNVAELAAGFGGGGHICAAGCSIEKPLTEARDEFLKKMNDQLND
jgi:phosphoesterase RecJ-like protein